jgi:hypothetical protein
MPESDPVSTSNGRLDREAQLTIGDHQISLTPIALRSAAFAPPLGEFVSRECDPLTWIKGVGAQAGTIRRAFAYAASGILLTVCLGFSPCS